MSWADRLVMAVGRRPLGLSVDWSAIEARMGTALPADYKEFCEIFGSGYFSDYLTVYDSVGGEDSRLADVYEGNWQIAEEDEAGRYYYAPYGLFRPNSQGGLLQWGTSVQGDEFAWLADSSMPPESWPVLARDDSQHSQHFAMSMSEFVYRLLADRSFEGFAGFGATEEAPDFTPYS
ncbi:SMI1/KNR4 family protein [Streptomyces sp. ICN441]|uniref:SMI1/KNR4 family protein n=1 Tax=Streptomyces sp. ICN441 TaxID=2558286 RepID=UPI00106AE177|nr:SMI1/KNR4 family protein [Streptomyces sp. ICN441]TFE58251.1 SMI1/KNR4 family protein [Streptomyces sp. ICN441]